MRSQYIYMWFPRFNSFVNIYIYLWIYVYGIWCARCGLVNWLEAPARHPKPTHQRHHRIGRTIRLCAQVNIEADAISAVFFLHAAASHLHLVNENVRCALQMCQYGRCVVRYAYVRVSTYIAVFARHCYLHTYTDSAHTTRSLSAYMRAHNQS